MIYYLCGVKRFIHISIAVLAVIMVSSCGSQKSLTRTGGLEGGGMGFSSAGMNMGMMNGDNMMDDNSQNEDLTAVSDTLFRMMDTGVTPNGGTAAVPEPK